MRILYCGDAGVETGIALSALSVRKHNPGELEVFILTAGQPIGSGFGVKLEKALGSGSRVRIFNLEQAFFADPPTANMDTRFTPFCMLRLYADLVPEITGRVLYLDADVMCRGSLSPLYDTDLTEAEIAGVPDRYGKWFFGKVLCHTYLNSGVLLMDMEKIRESGLFGKCRAMCREKKMFMPDQSALNKLARQKKLPRRWNEQAAIRPDTVCKHFTTFFRFFPRFRAVTIKPWQAEAMHTQLGITEFDPVLEDYQRSFES